MNDYDEHLKHLGKLLQEIKIDFIISKKVITINVDDDFSEVERIFVEKGIRHLPVVDDNKKLIGIITQRDVYKRVAPRRFIDGKIRYAKDKIIDEDGYYDKETLNQYILNHVMHKNPVSLKKENSIGEAIQLMVSKKIGCVPIVDEEKNVVGIITRFDILKLASDVFAENS